MEEIECKITLMGHVTTSGARKILGDFPTQVMVLFFFSFHHIGSHEAQIFIPFIRRALRGKERMSKTTRSWLGENIQIDAS